MCIFTQKLCNEGFFQTKSMEKGVMFQGFKKLELVVLYLEETKTLM